MNNPADLLGRKLGRWVARHDRRVKALDRMIAHAEAWIEERRKGESES
jgi:hypothetical protein